MRAPVLAGVTLALLISAAPAGAAGAAVTRAAKPPAAVKQGAGWTVKAGVRGRAMVRVYLAPARPTGRRRADLRRDLQLAGAGKPRRGRVRFAVLVPAGTPIGGYRALVCATLRACRDAGPVTVLADGVETRVDALSDAFPLADEEDDLTAITQTSAGMCAAVYPAPKKPFTEKRALASLRSFLTETAGADAMQAFAASPDAKTAGTARAAAVAALTQGAPGAALAAALRAQQLAPRRMEPLLNVAGLAVSLGHPAEALALLDAAARRREDGGAPMGIPHRTTGLATRAAALASLGRYAEARDAAGLALAAEPLLSEVAITGATAKACTGDTAGAVPLVRRGRRRSPGIPRADASGGVASALRPLQLPALPINALNMNDYYKDEMERAGGETTRLVARRNELEGQVRAYEDTLPRAGRRHLDGIQRLAYQVGDRPEIAAHREEINRQSRMIEDEICVIFGDFCSAVSKYDGWQDEASAACVGSNDPECYQREMLARCAPQTRIVHQAMVDHAATIDREQRALHTAASRLVSGYAANLFDPSAHALVMLGIDEEESALHAGGVQAIQSWTGSLAARGEHCVEQPPEPAALTASDPAESAEAGHCPSWLKGVNASIDFGGFKGKVNCQEIKLSADLGKGWITAFGEVAYNPRSDRLTVLGGSKFAAKLDGVGKAEFKSGLFLTVDSESLVDAGWRVGPSTTLGTGPLEYKAWSDDVDISFVPVVKPLLEAL